MISATVGETCVLIIFLPIPRPVCLCYVQNLRCRGSETTITTTLVILRLLCFRVLLAGQFSLCSSEEGTDATKLPQASRVPKCHRSRANSTKIGFSKCNGGKSICSVKRFDINIWPAPYVFNQRNVERFPNLRERLEEVKDDFC